MSATATSAAEVGVVVAAVLVVVVVAVATALAGNLAKLANARVFRLQAPASLKHRLIAECCEVPRTLKKRLHIEPGLQSQNPELAAG